MVTKLLILLCIVAAPSLALADDEPVIARPGDYVRVQVGDDDPVQGELLHVGAHDVTLRTDDTVPTVLSTDRLRRIEVSRSGHVPDHSTRLAWGLGGATFVGGWLIYFTAEDVDGDGNGWSALAEGIQQMIGTFVVFAGTPVMAGLGWLIGHVAENGEWHDARLAEEDLTARQDALLRQLALERAERAPTRPVGLSLSGTF